MIKESWFSFLNLFLVFALYFTVNFNHSVFWNVKDINNGKKFHIAQKSYLHQVNEDNTPPVVKIINPKNNSAFAWNTRIPYTITVSDQEDGESKYDEITNNEVFLEVEYIADTSRVTELLNQPVQSDPVGLAAIKKSNCLNCHAFDAKLIGPSFLEISERYTPTPSNIDILVQRIREGSSGIWGNVVMPTHPELSVEETEDIVHWILENAAKPNTSYFIGTEGSFQLKPPASSPQTGIFVLKATYTDHGAADAPPSKGQDLIMIRGKE